MRLVTPIAIQFHWVPVEMNLQKVAIGFVMTLEAESWHRFFQEYGAITAVGQMAIQTGILGRRMDGDGNLIVNQIIMAEDANEFCGCYKQIRLC